jgi:hypothetical protein
VNVVNHAPHGCHVLFCNELNQIINKVLHLHPRVDLPDGSYTLVPADEDKGGGGDVHYVAVEQDLDQSPEGPMASFANEGKPRFIINP